MNDEKKDEPRKPAEPSPERTTEKEPHPNKGAGRRGNVQMPPEKQRGTPEPKRKSPTQ